MELRCADLGLRCRSTVEGATQEELVRRIREHASDAHDVPELNETLVAYAVSRARDDRGGR